MISLFSDKRFLIFFPQLDHAAKTKNSAEAQKYYAETVTTLNDVLANLG